MEVSAQQSNLRMKGQDEKIELNELLLTTTNEIESNETTATKQTGGADAASVVEAPTIIEVDPEPNAQNDSEEGNSDDQSCCTFSK